ncbi:MAG: ParB/RepB/Spo0J family partition protein [Patescibacteria group bacterium]|jgi:ParB family chromosome partitioning protein|nr:ParB/RepB/Spo0J family partition protein [Patescibacteria group bacterium]
MATKNRLGRGLDALIPVNMDEFVADSLPDGLKDNSNDVATIAIDKISPNPHQPRSEFLESDLKDLASSIKLHGVIQPLVVIKTKPGYFQLVAGERRMRASKLAGLSTVPAIVRTFSEQEQLELAVIENIQRADLKPLEVAIAYNKLVDQFNLTHLQISKRVGKGASTVSNAIRLVNLPHPAKLALQKGQISEGHARAILSLNETADQLQLLETIIKSRLTVREAEEAVRRYKDGNVDSKPPKAVKIRSEHAVLINSIGKYLATKVTIHKTAKGGRLQIEYYSDEELERIAEQIKGQN